LSREGKQSGPEQVLFKESLKPSSRRLFILMLSCATFLALIYGARNIFSSVSLQRPLDLVRALGFEFVYWYVWVAFTPAVIWFARKFDFQRNAAKSVFALIAFGLLIAPLQATVEFSLAYAIDLLRGMPAQEMAVRRHLLPRVIAVETFGNFIVYTLIVCGYYAYDYYRKYREREIRSVELEGRLAQAELQNLKMQLHPHFLFNTLHTISVLMMRDANLANRMLIRLSDLLRITLDNTGNQMVPLKQELDFLSGYLEIEQTRFQDRLTVNIDVQPAALDARVPNLILQPIVENAIRHGIASQPGSGTIQLRASIVGPVLRVEVRDDGPGLDGSFKKGIGLTNTEARLRQLYGTSHSFDIANAPDGGVQVTLTIPVNGR
jgi:two-component system LytT family sensor kinase